jgi:CubicO group peptidase (beta-lactamase class C family)
MMLKRNQPLSPVFFILLYLLPVCMAAQTGKTSLETKIKQVENSLSPGVVYGDTIPRWNIETRMAETHIKGLSIAVINNYRVEWAKGYGWADEASGKKVTTSTRFQAASISKSLNSMGILKLIQERKLDPEADINQYLKGWQFPYDSLSKNKKINTYQLLSHTAGLDIHGFPGYDRADTLPTLIQILNGEKPANTKAVRSLFEPGKQFQYSGGGTTISQLLLMSISGADYADYMQKEVLRPLGMTNSSFQQPPSETSNLATGYYQDGKPVSGKYHVYPEQAAAGLWTTPTDLAKYIIECQLALQGKSKKVLLPAMMKKRLTPYMDSVFALGAFIENRNGHKFFQHNGGNEAFLCTSYGSMEGGKGVVIMINGENFSILSELLNSVAQVYNWDGFYKPEFKKVVMVPKDTLAQYVGDYTILKDTISLQFCGEQLCLLQNRGSANGYKVYFSDNQHFSVSEEPSANFKVLFNLEGKVEALELKQRGTTIKCPRLQ